MRMKKRFNSPLEGRMRGVKGIIDVIPPQSSFKWGNELNKILKK
jgi:hypothetical protein